MLKKLIKKLKDPGVLTVIGITLVAAAGVILACSLYQSDGEQVPPEAVGQQGETVMTDNTVQRPSGEIVETTDPTVSEPESTEPTASEPESTEPTASEPESTEPTASEPESTDPTSTEPQPTDPIPIDPEKPDQTENPGIPPEPEIPHVTVPEEKELTVQQVAAFSGAYVEDGSDEPVTNVAAVLVTNETEDFLDLGTLVYDIDGKEAKFIVTGLPSGASAWVMEASRITVKEDAVFTQKSCETSFRQDAVSSTEDVTIQSAGNMLKAVNNSGKVLRNVTVYYKAVHTDGNFFGGITYMTIFGDLQPGQSAEKLAGHFKEGWATLVRIGYQTDEPSP